MAYVRLGQSTETKVAGSTIGLLPPTLNVATDHLLVAFMVFDNTSATAPTVTGIAKESGETNNWVKLASFDSSNASSAAGCRGEIWAIRTTKVWSSGGPYNATLSASVGGKISYTIDFDLTTTTIRGAAGTGTSTAGAPSASTTGATPQVGDLVLALGGFETNADPSAGAGFTGNWVWGTTGGGGSTTHLRGVIGFKEVTSAGHMTWSPSGSSDSGACVVALVAAPPPLPGKPANVQQSNGYAEAIELDFTPGTNATLGHNLYRYISGPPGSEVVELVNDVAAGLTNGWYDGEGINSGNTNFGLKCAPTQKHQLAVAGVNVTGEGPRSDFNISSYARPRPAAGHTATPHADGLAVTLTFPALFYARTAKVFRDGVLIGMPYIAADAVGTFIDDNDGAGLVAGTPYAYTFTWRADGSRLSQVSTAANATPTALSAPTTPSAPARVTAHPDGDNAIIVRWRKKLYTTAYRIYRDGVLVHTSANDATSWQDTGVTNGNTYSYEVASYYLGGNESAKSAAVSCLSEAAIVALPESEVTRSSAGVYSAAAGAHRGIDTGWQGTTDDPTWVNTNQSINQGGSTQDPGVVQLSTSVTVRLPYTLPAGKIVASGIKLGWRAGLQGDSQGSIAAVGDDSGGSLATANVTLANSDTWQEVTVADANYQWLDSGPNRAIKVSLTSTIPNVTDAAQALAFKSVAVKIPVTDGAPAPANFKATLDGFQPTYVATWTWDAVPGATDYRLYDHNGTLIGTFTDASRSYTMDASLGGDTGKALTWSVAARISGQEGASATATAQLLPPKPTLFRAMPWGTGAARVEYSVSGVTDFALRVYRDGVLVGETPKPVVSGTVYSFVDDVLTDGQQYTYLVRTYRDGAFPEESDDSTSAHVTPGVCDDLLPDADTSTTGAVTLVGGATSFGILDDGFQTFSGAPSLGVPEADYVQLAPLSGAPAATRVSLDPFSLPAGHIVSDVWITYNAGTTDGANLNNLGTKQVILRQGSTVIKTVDLPRFQIVCNRVQLTTAELATLTDYSDLSIELVANWAASTPTLRYYNASLRVVHYDDTVVSGPPPFAGFGIPL